MQVLKGSILNVTEGIIAHQTNCMGIAGAGLALQIANAYPTGRQTTSPIATDMTATLPTSWAWYTYIT